ncbi:hypothetical protein HNQ08_000398 [Deinococcus humi]|uniref:Uncharacterized protein n=1 Tax=Deinococcus humi TaxID=662880 RepID=A0A7W8JQH2_9DEIO|nr:hypothetical protein [Deinococcus humi]
MKHLRSDPFDAALFLCAVLAVLLLARALGMLP